MATNESRNGKTSKTSTSTPDPENNSGGFNGQAGHPDDNDNSFEAAVQRNLERNSEARATSNKWFALGDKEIAQVEFTGNFGPVKKDFDKDGIPEKVVYEYEMKDRRHEDPQIQTWSLSKTWSEKLDKLLKRGHKLIECYREGTKKNNTNYEFRPLDKGSGFAGAA